MIYTGVHGVYKNKDLRNDCHASLCTQTVAKLVDISVHHTSTVDEHIGL